MGVGVALFLNRCMILFIVALLFVFGDNMYNRLYNNKLYRLYYIREIDYAICCL